MRERRRLHAPDRDVRLAAVDLPQAHREVAVSADASGRPSSSSAISGSALHENLGLRRGEKKLSPSDVEPGRRKTATSSCPDSVKSVAKPLLEREHAGEHRDGRADAEHGEERRRPPDEEAAQVVAEGDERHQTTARSASTATSRRARQPATMPATSPTTSGDAERQARSSPVDREAGKKLPETAASTGSSAQRRGRCRRARRARQRRSDSERRSPKTRRPRSPSPSSRRDRASARAPP